MNAPQADLITYRGMPAVHLSTSDGAQATVLTHGAHLVSWRPAGGVEQLYLSDRAVFGPTKAVRGGVPVIFPQFERRGPLPRHGFARQRAWTLVQREPGAATRATLRLGDDESSRQIWPHGFETELSLRLSAQRLTLELSVVNTGALGFGFTAALHTYLAVSDVTQVRLDGLQGRRFEDGLRQRQHDTDTAASLSVTGEIERLYLEVDAPLILHDGERSLRVESSGFRDTMVWNPGPEKVHAIDDMPAGDWRRMLCVEAGVVAKPVMLAPGAGWTGRQILTAA